MTIKHQPGAPINDGANWMQKPEGNNDIPPGLEYLAIVDNIQIKQKHELLEIALGWETNNKYVIMNGVGQQIYYAFEETGCCSRQCCGAQRGFIMHIVDNFGKEVMRINREFMLCAGCGCCAVPGSCCSHRLTVEAPPGNVIGTVNQRVSCCTGAYQVCDADGNAVLDCEGPGPCIMCGCGDKVFEVRTNSGAEIGAIRKKWAGFLQETFTDSDNFGVNFPIDLSVRTKATLIGATFLIDFMHFETKDDGHHS
ncbi:hypothetical protein PFISCL1PPCAC_18820 [Pristionchus fissidentatus]|uniref:Phospholipid scramblase n=1 Tax=Pristionchus fissidentatus TaxID=1538716 RepID=A0AAV5WAV0_9BILA|nr:hypothetical protein PFISCL1PPCAC_18820 [Pristionchus fissidentatus]